MRDLYIGTESHLALNFPTKCKFYSKYEVSYQDRSRAVTGLKISKKKFVELGCTVISCDQAVKIEIISKNIKKMTKKWQFFTYFQSLFFILTTWSQYLTLKPRGTFTYYVRVKKVPKIALRNK